MTNKTQMEELRSHVESAADCGFIHNASIDGRLLASLLDQLEADETRIAELEGIVSRQKDTLVKYRKDVLETHAELAALREAAVPAGKFVFEPAGQRWHHVKHGEHQFTEPKLPMVKLFTRPQPMPVVVLPKPYSVEVRHGDLLFEHDKDGDNYDREEIHEVLKNAGIKFNSADGEGE